MTTPPLSCSSSHESSEAASASCCWRCLMRIRPRRSAAQRRRRRWCRLAAAAVVAGVWLAVAATFGAFLFHDRRSVGAKKLVASSGSSELEARNEVAPGAPQPPSSALKPYESPLLIFTCKRDKYLQETLDTILKYIPRDCSMGCPVIVSQDGDHAGVAAVVRQAQARFTAEAGLPVLHLRHTSALRGATADGPNAYQALATHYGWALRQVFEDRALAPGHPVSPQRVLILEEDLRVAPDFFGFFAAMAPLLDADPTLLAVSAFNDNGLRGRVRDSARVLRSDFFPGLGWLLTRRLWDAELRAIWPTGYWDDWLRDRARRRGRHILRPEVSRTYHFGFEGGASGNQFGSLLEQIQLEENGVEWNSIDLSTLSLEKFDSKYWTVISSAKQATSISEALEASRSSDVRLEYRDKYQFEEFAAMLKLMQDEKDGIFRTAYNGVVETRPHGDKLLFLTPPFGELEKEFHLGPIR